MEKYQKVCNLIYNMHENYILERKWKSHFVIYYLSTRWRVSLLDELHSRSTNLQTEQGVRLSNIECFPGSGVDAWSGLCHPHYLQHQICQAGLPWGTHGQFQINISDVKINYKNVPMVDNYRNIRKNMCHYLFKIKF